jgi:hypothetical protein
MGENDGVAAAAGQRDGVVEQASDGLHLASFASVPGPPRRS